MLIQFNSMSYVTLQNTSRAPFVSDNFIRTIEVLPRKHRLSQSVTLEGEQLHFVLQESWQNMYKV